MKIKKMINISKFLMLLALCNPIISANKEENSEMLVCPEYNHVEDILNQYVCQKVVDLLNYQLKKPFIVGEAENVLIPEYLVHMRYLVKNQLSFIFAFTNS